MLYQQIKAGDYSFPAPYWSDISSSAKDLIRHCLQVDPTKRYTASQVLAHPWVGGKDVSTKAIAGGYSKRLIVLQVKRRLRKAIQVITAINRFARAIEDDRVHAVKESEMEKGAGAGKVSKGEGHAHLHVVETETVTRSSLSGAVVVQTVQHTFAT
jgi:serine/threonine protein kinase